MKKVQSSNMHKKVEPESTLPAAEKDKEPPSRRRFLKKSVYSAPVLMALGQLVKPTDVQAQNSVPGPPVWG